MRKSIVNLFVVTLAMLGGFFICFPIASAEQNIYISQAQITAGSGHTADDFVELYNPNSANFNLKGYRLVKRTAQGTSDTLIKSWTGDTWVPPKSFYLWANSGFTTISVAPDTATSGTLANDNGVAIRFGANDTGAIVDSIAWGNTSNTFRNVSATNPTANLSLVRNDLKAADSGFSLAPSAPRNFKNPLATDASAPADTGPKQGTAVQPDASFSRKSAEVKISEILPDPAGEDAGHEAVELENSDSLPVNVTGWYLADKSAVSAPGSTAYALPETVINPGAAAVVVIPKDYFVLNNSGSETLNLFFSDGTLADSVSYGGPTKEGQTYQKVDGDWLWGVGTLGVQNAQALGAPAEGDISITEILPNPQGADEGKEWVEIYNASGAPVDLKNYVLDGGLGKITPGRAAYKILAATILPSQGYLAITLPEDAFGLSNLGDMVSLYNPGGKLLQQILYPQSSSEGQAYFVDDKGKWQYGQATPGKSNAPDERFKGLEITEILPNPKDGQDEFVEIKNSGSAEVALAGLNLRVASKQGSLPDIKLKAGEYLTVYESDLPAKLRNTREEVSLLDSEGKLLNAAAYEESLKGEAWAETLDGNFLWTSLPTPNAANQFVLAAASLAPAANAPVASEKASAKTPAAKAASATAAEKQLLMEIADLKVSLAELSGQLSRLAEAPLPSGRVLGTNLNAEASPPAQAAPRDTSTGFWFYVLVVGLSLVCLALLILVNRERVKN